MEPRQGDAHPATHSQMQEHLTEMCRQFEKAWRNGQRPSIDEYLALVDESGVSALLSRLVPLELRLLREAGETPSSADYLSRFPGHRVILEGVLTGESTVTSPSTFAPSPDRLSEEAELPQHFGRYRILRKLGRGGMGTIYLAHDELLDRQIALKTPRFGEGCSAELIDRFYQEARAAAALRHPNICPVFDVGEIGGVHHIAMAFVDGQSLAEAKVKTMPSEEIVRIVATVADALAEAHRQGVIHRDVKPSNIMIDQRGQPVVTDFGLARRQGVQEVQITLEGSPVGTPGYMAPEQVRGELNIGPETDVYGLGVVLYELLAGRLPYAGSIAEVWSAILNVDPPPPSFHQSELDRRLEAICLQAMARCRDDRFASMTEFSAALRQFGRHRLTSATACNSDYPVAAEVLGEVRRWGWSSGVARLIDSIEAENSPSYRRALESVVLWVKGSDEVVPDCSAEERRELEGWRLIGRAISATRKRAYSRAAGLLEQIQSLVDNDVVLAATASHCRGTLLARQGRVDEALGWLHRALEEIGRNHFLSGRILDSLGKAYAIRNNYHAARQFYDRAIAAKQTWSDETGLAVTQGQLGRLCLEWGQLEAAEKHFRQDLEIIERLGDARAAAMLYNHLGQVYLARNAPDEALSYLDESLQLTLEHGYPLEEAFTRKDMALALVRVGEVTQARQEAGKAQSIFRGRKFEEGLAHSGHALALCLAEDGESRDAERLLRDAAASFERTGETAESARVLLTLARVRRGRKSASRLVTDSILKALKLAEKCGRGNLVREIEEELKIINEAEYYRHAFLRARGRHLGDGPVSLERVQTRLTSIMNFELEDDQNLSTEDPSAAFMTLNQMFAELVPVLEKHGVEVIQYTGEGFVAISQAGRRAYRAVACGLNLIATLNEFNRPRRVLGLPEVRAHLGIATGPAILGETGTWLKTDYAAIGDARLLAACLQHGSHPVCICKRTYDDVRNHFTFSARSPRRLDVPGLGHQKVWDVVNRTESAAESG